MSNATIAFFKTKKLDYSGGTIVAFVNATISNAAIGPIVAFLVPIKEVQWLAIEMTRNNIHIIMVY